MPIKAYLRLIKNQTFSRNQYIADSIKIETIAVLDIEYVVIWELNLPENYKELFLKYLTRISQASFSWDIGKKCRPRSDAAERGVWSGTPLFVYRMFYQNLNKNEKYHLTP